MNDSDRLPTIIVLIFVMILFLVGSLFSLNRLIGSTKLAADVLEETLNEIQSENNETTRIYIEVPSDSVDKIIEIVE